MSERLNLLLGRVMTFRIADLEREEGQGVTEYGLVLAFVAIALAAVLLVLHGRITSFINIVGDDLGNLPGNL
jgi:Flp pilus assembly pilin Flp